MYPDSIVEYAQKLTSVLLGDFIEITKYTEEFCKPIVEKEISDFMMPKFLDGSEIIMTEKEFEECFKQCLTSLSIESLKSKGLVDTMEDENGELMIFPTKKGKELPLNKQ